MSNPAELAKMAQKLRRLSIEMTTAAGSGHPSSCMSMAEIMSVLFFHEMRFAPNDPAAHDTDIFVLSKGHSAPILWAALKEAGGIPEDLNTLRKFDSVLEGHPTFRSPWVRVATGSLGQGLSAAAGMAFSRKNIDKAQGRFFCLLGDGESAEGAVWEAAQLAGHAHLDNLCAIVDVNRLGQSGPTMVGHNTAFFQSLFEAYGWNAIVVDGHNVEEVLSAFANARSTKGKPTAIIAKTLKGKGFSKVEDKEGHHGKPFSAEVAKEAIAELGDTDITIKVEDRRYGDFSRTAVSKVTLSPSYKKGESVATRAAYGDALKECGEKNPSVVGLDADVKNSTMGEKLKKTFPDRFVDAYIAEQNMVGMTLGIATEGKVPFAATFACFFSRAYDFIRMAGYSKPKHMILCGSHSGVSIGEDGPSQMGLEDLAMFRPVFNSIVLYPSDAVSTFRLVEEANNTEGIVYIRTTRPGTAVIYDNDEKFPIGGSKTVRSSPNDKITIIGAGVTLHEAIKAADALKNEGIHATVIDMYSIKPLDEAAVREAVKRGPIVTVEDHSIFGGLGEAVAGAAAGGTVVRLGVTEPPRSATSSELLAWAGIDSNGIVKAVKAALQ